MSKRSLVVLAALALAQQAYADVWLSAYNFNSTQFGNTLVESDGGAFSAGNWLNSANANPGNPGYLTGPNFDTGIANIGIGGSVLYTIGYSSAIVNGPGADLGIVTARFSTGDTVQLNVSTNGGTTYAGLLSFGPALANATGVACNYFYGGGGPHACNLFVTEVDLSDYGLALGDSINAVQVSGAPELDLIRVAGFGEPNGAPEPASLAVTGLALAALALSRLRRRAS